MARFQAGYIEDVPHQAIQTFDGLMDFSNHRLLRIRKGDVLEFEEIAGGTLDRCNRSTNLMRHGVKQGFAKAFRLCHQLGLPLSFLMGPDLGGQLSKNYGEDEIHSQKHGILNVTDSEGKNGRQKKIIP